MIVKKLPLALVLGAALAMNAPSAMAQSEETGGEDPVLATVNGKPIYRSEVVEAAEQQLPAQYQSGIEQAIPALLQRMIDVQLIGDAAIAAGYEDNEQVQELVAEAKENIILNIYLQDAVSARISDEDLQTAYDGFLADNPPQTEVHARHILLEDEAAAKEVIAELENGGDFVTLAQERSTGPSGPNGGDLGYFTADRMVPEFSAAAFELAPGEFSKEPVQTQFGYHVIKVEDKRDTVSPTLEEMEPQLREEMTAQVVQDLLAELREGAEIEVIIPEGQGEAAEDPAAGAEAETETDETAQ